MEQRIYTIEFSDNATRLTQHISTVLPFSWIGQNIRHYPEGISHLTITPAMDGNLYHPF